MLRYNCPRCGKLDVIEDLDPIRYRVERHYCSYPCLFADEADERSAYVRPAGKSVDDLQHWYIEMTFGGSRRFKSEGIQAFDASSARSRAHTQAYIAGLLPGAPTFEGPADYPVCIPFPSKNMMREQAKTRGGRFRQWWNGDRKTWWDRDEQAGLRGKS